MQHFLVMGTFTGQQRVVTMGSRRYVFTVDRRLVCAGNGGEQEGDRGDDCPY
ncbi:MAG TPA: hypothetical protein VJY33_11350 [Isosphaeraceae bacterium]|nr:hypothetical protein [Isosphaeraceae bacterium]